MEPNVTKSKLELDVFRDTPVRLLGYSNEVGEAFRSVVNVKWVWLSYGVATAYVLADTVSKTLAVRKLPFPSEQERNLKTIKEGVDVLTWQTLASVVIPGLTINRICATANYFISRSYLKKQSKWLTVVFGLTSIPFIIKPIDNFVDYIMDAAVRPIMDNERPQKQEKLSTKGAIKQ